MNSIEEIYGSAFYDEMQRCQTSLVPFCVFFNIIVSKLIGGRYATIIHMKMSERDGGDKDQISEEKFDFFSGLKEVSRSAEREHTKWNLQQKRDKNDSWWHIL